MRLINKDLVHDEDTLLPRVSGRFYQPLKFPEEKINILGYSNAKIVPKAFRCGATKCEKANQTEKSATEENRSQGKRFEDVKSLSSEADFPFVRDEACWRMRDKNDDTNRVNKVMSPPEEDTPISRTSGSFYHPLIFPGRSIDIPGYSNANIIPNALRSRSVNCEGEKGYSNWKIVPKALRPQTTNSDKINEERKVDPSDDDLPDYGKFY